MTSCRCPTCGHAVDQDAVLLDRATHTVTVGGVIRQMTPLEFVMIDALVAKRPGHVTRDQIFAALYGNRYDGGPDCGHKVIDVLVCRARRAFVGTRLHLETVWGVGYRAIVRSEPFALKTKSFFGEAHAYRAA